MNWVHFVAGTVVLLFGRPLYWVVVAVLGFLLGFDLVRDLAISESEFIQILVAIGAGIIAAGLAVAFQWIAFGLVGFLSGSYLVQAAIERYAIAVSHEELWILVGGAIGGFVALMLVDWAVIVLTSLAGATMITNPLNLEEQTRLAIFVGLLIVGVVFQRSRLDRKKMRPLRGG